MTKLQNPEQVADTRKTNIEFNFNMVTAMAALKATPLKSKASRGCGMTGELSKNIKVCLNTAKDNGIIQISPKQVTEMIAANATTKLDKEAYGDLNHAISTTMWNWCKTSEPLLKRVASGIYEIL